MDRVSHALALLASAIITAGCVTPGAASPAATQAPSVTSGAASRAASPSAPRESSPLPTIAPPGTPVRTPPASRPPGSPTTSAPATVPPDAVLTVAGAEHVGRLGGYSFRGRHADVPYVPARVLERVAVAPGADMSVRLAGDIGIQHWTAAVAAASDSDGEPGVMLAQGTGLVRFDGPVRGSWVLTLSVTYADDVGDAVYHWHLAVR